MAVEVIGRDERLERNDDRSIEVAVSWRAEHGRNLLGTSDTLHTPLIALEAPSIMYRAGKIRRDEVVVCERRTIETQSIPTQRGAKLTWGLLIVTVLAGCTPSRRPQVSVSPRAPQSVALRSLISSLTVPYRDPHARLLQEGGHDATVALTAQVQDHPNGAWTTEGATFGLRHANGSWYVWASEGLEPLQTAEAEWERSRIVVTIRRLLWKPGKGTFFPLIFTNPGRYRHTVTWFITVLTNGSRWHDDAPSVGNNRPIATGLPPGASRHIELFLSPRQLRRRPERLLYGIDDEGYNGALCELSPTKASEYWYGDYCPHRLYT